MKREHFQFLLVLSIYFFLIQWPIRADLPVPNHTDDGEYIFDYFDRSSIDAITNIGLQTFDENANSHYVPLNTILFKGLYLLHVYVGVSIYVVLSLFHLCNTILFFCIGRLFFKNITILYVSTFVFLNAVFLTGVLNWFAAGFNHITTQLFCLLAMYCWLSYIARKAIFYFLFSLFFLLCAFSMKPLSLFLPFSMTLLIINNESNVRGIVESLKENTTLIEKLCFFYISVFPFFYFESYMYPFGAVARRWGGIELGLHPLLRMFDLFAYSTLGNDISNIGMICFVFTMIFFIFLVAWYAIFSRSGITLFWLSWSLLSCLLVFSTNFRDIHSLVRYLYFPLTGIIFIVGYVLDNYLCQRNKESCKREQNTFSC